MAREDFTGFNVLAGNERDLNVANKRRRSAQHDLAAALDASNEKLIGFNQEHYNTTSLHMEQAGRLFCRALYPPRSHRDALSSEYSLLRIQMT